MAQHIRVTKISDKNIIIANLDVNFADIVNLLYKIDSFETNFPWIFTINQYGDTTFNTLQIPLLIKDLQKMTLEIQDTQCIESINRVITFIQTTSAHQYIKFVGD